MSLDLGEQGYYFTVLAFNANTIKARLKETLKSRDHLFFVSMIYDC